jgi:integrase
VYVRRGSGGRWRVEYRDAAGQRHGKTFDRKRDAEAWGADREAEVRRGRHVDPRQSRQPFHLLAERWWDGRVVEASTAANDRLRLDKHVLPEWGRWPVEAITTSAVQGWVRRLAKSDLSPWTIRACYHLLSSALDTARMDHLIPDNPCRGVQLPAKPPGRQVYLTRDEVDAVAAAMNRPGPAAGFDRCVLYTLAYTGLRWSELSGLRRRRLDPLLRTLDVVDTLVEVNGRFQRKAYPKGRRRRTVPIPALLRELLAEHLRRYPAELDELVFRPMLLGYRHGRSAALSRHHWPRTAFRPAVAAALGRADVHVHDLRHSYASWLVQDGVPLYEVQRLLGHADAASSMVYAHLAPDQFERARRVLDGPGRASQARHHIDR